MHKSESVLGGLCFCTMFLVFMIIPLIVYESVQTRDKIDALQEQIAAMKPAPAPPQGLKQELDQSCTQWLFKSNMKQVKERICHK